MATEEFEEYANICDDESVEKDDAIKDLKPLDMFFKNGRVTFK